jgi:hypothetical protein
MTSCLGPLIAALAASTCALPERKAVCDDVSRSAEIFGALGCDLCGSESCCTEAQACSDEPGCASLMGCYRSCSTRGEASCFEACRASTSFDFARAEKLLACLSRHCESTGCPLPERAVSCPDLPHVTDVFAPTSCDLCIRSRLCAAAQSCAERESCAQRLACVAQCTGPNLNPACFDQCRADGEENPGDGAFFAAVSATCRTECAAGSEFQCVKQYHWPPPTSARVTVGHRAINRLNNAPFVGLEVRACAAGPADCDSVGQPEVVLTDDLGFVTVNVPTTSPFGMEKGFDGYLLWQDPSGDEAEWLETILHHTRLEYRHRLPEETSPFARGVLVSGFFNLLAKTKDIEIDPRKGMLVGGVVDCHGRFEFFAPGIHLEIPEAGDDLLVVYVNDSQDSPDFDATATTKAGQFMAANVPTGRPNVVLRRTDNGEIIAAPKVFIRPGILTVLAAWPDTR